MLSDEKRRPGRDAASLGNLHSDSNATSADLAARAAMSGYALKVMAQRVDGVIVVQLYTTMAGAQRKVSRTQKRGLWAAMFLVRVEPITEARPLTEFEDIRLIGGDVA